VEKKTYAAGVNLKLSCLAKAQGVSIGHIPNGAIQLTLAKKMNIVRVRCRVKIMAK